MDLPWKKEINDQPLNGTELMLRSLGLGDVITAAKAFANEQTFQKIMAFADQVGVLTEIIRRVDDRLTRIEAAQNADRNGVAISGDLFTDPEQSSASSGSANSAIPAGPSLSTPREYRAAG